MELKNGGVTGKMSQKVSMYQITKELIEEDGCGDADSATIKSQNSNNCKYLIKVLNAVGIDETLFKGSKGYSFTVESKDAVKEIIKKHEDYSKEMKKSLPDRDIKILDELASHIKTILNNEIDDEDRLSVELARVEIFTYRELIRLNRYLQKLMYVDWDKTLSFEDNAVLQMYYIEEMKALKDKFQKIREIFSDIRNEGLLEKSFQEADDMSSKKPSGREKIVLEAPLIKKFLDPKNKEDLLVQEELKNLANYSNMTPKQLIEEMEAFRQSNYQEHHLFELKKIVLDRLVIRKLLDPKKQKDESVQEGWRRLSELLGINTSMLIKEMKVFQQSNYQEHHLFELKSNEQMHSYDSPYDVLEQAKEEYENQEAINRDIVQLSKQMEVEKLINSFNEKNSNHSSLFKS